MESITVEKNGLLVTIQDLGREEYQQYGVSIGGAMDKLACRIGNILVGNHEDCAVIEFAVVGPRLKFQGNGYIAITGADCTPQLNGNTISMWKVIPFKEGDILKFGKNKSGRYTYIAIAGGINVPKILGSRSTSIRGKYGGMEGRLLRKGDQIAIGKVDSRKPLRLNGRKLMADCIPVYSNRQTIRFIWGPHEDFFDEYSKEVFTSTPYKVSRESDQMGYRLEGEKLRHRNTVDILSYYITPGAVQVPRNGCPILLMPHCGMSGGYTVIGTVIEADLPFAAQKKEGESIQFKPVTIEEAIEELKQQEHWIKLLSLNNYH